jgi:predicted nucleotidyltransferase
VSDIAGIYGFGSFFRSHDYNDVDLLVIATRDCENSLATYYRLQDSLAILGAKFGVHFDMTFLTSREYHEAPLREKHRLVPLFVTPSMRRIANEKQET